MDSAEGSRSSREDVAHGLSRSFVLLFSFTFVFKLEEGCSVFRSQHLKSRDPMQCLGGQLGGGCYQHEVGVQVDAPAQPFCSVFIRI